jgi:hypothetical protein
MVGVALSAAMRGNKSRGAGLGRGRDPSIGYRTFSNRRPSQLGLDRDQAFDNPLIGHWRISLAACLHLTCIFMNCNKFVDYRWSDKGDIRKSLPIRQ